MNTYLPGLLISITCLILCGFAYKSYLKDKINLALLFILLTGFILRINIYSDKYLHTWDERYHALVAKNLLDNPLKPALYAQPLLPYDVENWVANHIWLDKGPIPLWTMAVSLKIFGLNEWALRIPSLVVSLIAVYLTFCLGRLLIDERTGLLAAFLHAIHGLLIEVAGGKVSSDHVETMFSFFMEAAVFVAAVSVVRRKRLKYSLAIGVLAGLAFLCKWTPALLVFPLWFFLSWKFRGTSKRVTYAGWIAGVLAFLITTLPWLWYVYRHFPEESYYVFRKFTFAYSETLEKHTGPWYYYFKTTGMVFGELVWIAILLSIVLVLQKRSSRFLAILLLWWFIPFVVFSFAETKRHTYLLLSAPALFLLTANAFLFLRDQKQSSKWVRLLLFLVLIGLPIRYSFERTKLFTKVERNPQWADELRSLNGKYPSNTVFVNHPHAIEGMFYTDYIFYGHLPQTEELSQLGKNGFKVVRYESSY